MTIEIIPICDLTIMVAYYSIPLQILISLWKSPKNRTLPRKLVFTLVLFAAFIFLCGTGHLMRFLGLGGTTAFVYVNIATALVSIATAVFLIPLIPCIFSILDDSLNKLTDESKESKSKLFTFMAFLCHEIRNPLFAITSSAEFLKDTALHPEQAEEVSSICDSSLLMLRLVNDVLDLSKLDSGKLELESREFDLHSLLTRLGDNMTRQITRKHKGAVNLVFELTQDVPRIISGDSTRILQIVYNLLSNSIKFTSEGKIDLIVKLADEESERRELEASRNNGAHTVFMSKDQGLSPLSNLDGTSAPSASSSGDDEQNFFSMALLDGDANADMEAGRNNADSSGDDDDEDIMVLSITVGDTGIGIPSDRLRTIFEPYTQAKLSDFRQHGGTGLGLSIISSLVKAMGGNVSVTSKDGEGTKFHLKIPIHVPRNPTFTAAPDDEMPGAPGGDSDNALESHRMPVYEGNNPGTMPPSGQQQQGGEASSDSQPQSLFQIAPQNSNGSTDVASAMATGGNSSFRELPAPRRASVSKTALPPFNFSPQSNVVLVVDDNKVNRKIIGKMLSAYKVEYETACNGREAVDALLASRNATGDPARPQYGLVFMDVSMPVMDGNAAITAIRKAKISVPIVALSANVLTQERDRTIWLGANESHTKPILRSDLHMLCTRFLYTEANAKPRDNSPSAESSTVCDGRHSKRCTLHQCCLKEKENSGHHQRVLSLPISVNLL